MLDVAGVGLGHATVHRDEPPPPDGRGIARTGVTVLVLAEDAYLAPAAGRRRGAQRRRRVHRLPHRRGVGLARDAGLPDLDHAARPGVRRGLRDRARAQHPEVADDVVIPVVGECDDSFLNDCRRMQVDARTTCGPPGEAALASRGSTAAAGRGRGRRPAPGMSCLGFKGGIGTSSRVTAGRPHRRGAADDQLRVARAADRGRRARRAAARRRRRAPRRRTTPAGSCIGVVVTDAPVDGAALRAAGPPDRARPGPRRLGRPPRQRRDLPGGRAPACGSTATARPDRPPAVAGRALDPLFEAVVEAAEEAVLNSMFTAPTTVGRDGNTSESLHPDAVVLELLDGARS